MALYGGAKHITVSDCQCLDPISIITGGRLHAFVMDDDTLCLVRNYYTRQDRHQFVTQSLTTGPNVFVDCVSDNARAEAGPHHRWATAAIWDNITAEHIQRMLKIPIPVYREQVAGKFNPTEFNADEWIRTAKEAGMGYPDTTTKGGGHASRNAGFIRQPQCGSPACRMNPAFRWWCQDAPFSERVQNKVFAASD